MTANECFHEDLIQSQTKDIERLKTRADYKDKRIDDLYVKMEKMEEKLDTMNDNINKLILKSNKEDNKLEQRLIAIETELETNKNALQDNRNRFTMIISVVTIFFTALTFIFNFMLR